MRKSVSWNCYLIKKANCIFALSLRWSSILTFLFLLYCLFSSWLWSLVLVFTLLRLPRSRSYAEYCIFTTTSTLALSILSPDLTAFQYCRIGPILCCVLLPSVHLCMLVRTIFCDSSSTCYSCGYNNLFYHRHLKRYDYQYQMCASIVPITPILLVC